VPCSRWAPKGSLVTTVGCSRSLLQPMIDKSTVVKMCQIDLAATELFDPELSWPRVDVVNRANALTRRMAYPAIEAWVLSL
jgi:hypothetical protein